MKKLLLVLPVVCLLLACGCPQTEEEPPAQPEITGEEKKVVPEEKETPAPVEPQETQGEEKEGQEPAGEEAGEAEEGAQEGAQEGAEEAVKEGTEAEETVVDVEVGVLETKFGKMVIQFYPDLAPKTVARIKQLIREGFYDGLIFHRIVPGFCLQGGDPTGTGRGGTGVNIPGEFTNTPFVDGSLGMARSNDPNSNDCQFFITLGRTANLDNKYTLFGKVVEGLDVAHKIEAVPLEGQEGFTKPKEKVQITSFRLEERKLKE